VEGRRRDETGETMQGGVPCTFIDSALTSAVVTFATGGEPSQPTSI